MHRRHHPHHAKTSRHGYNYNTSPPSPATTLTAQTTGTATTLRATRPQSSNSSAAAGASKKAPGKTQHQHHRKSASTQLPPTHQTTHNHHHHHHHHHNNTHNRRKSSHHAISKLLGPGSGPANWSVQPDDDKPEMATSFLQYCAMCEKQITVPCNSVLYCSESCRRKDSRKPLSASSYAFTVTTTTTTTTTPPSSPPMSPPMSPRAIVAPMTPTRSSSPTATALATIPSNLHEAKTDLDPTEWKPVIHQHQPPRPHHHRASSSAVSLASYSSSAHSTTEAWTFLSQFHHRPSHPQAQPQRDERRQQTAAAATPHRSSASLSSLTPGLTPSLTNTPSTVASSLNSNGSDPGSPTDYINYGYHAAAATRPLPPRHNPSYTAATKGVELVVPHIAAPVLFDSAAEDMSLASSPADGHDSGLWLKPHRRQSKTAATTTTSITTSNAVKTH